MKKLTRWPMCSSIPGGKLMALLCILALHAQFSIGAGIAAPTADWNGKAEGPEWTALITAAIKERGDGLIRTLPLDMASYCPRYESFRPKQKRLFWARLFSVLAHFESGYDPATEFQESFKDNAGKFVISRGLLQISKESANGYRCAITDEKALHTPEINLSCAVRIAKQWISKDGFISRKTQAGKWEGLARYWSPFRSESKQKIIMATLRKSPGCVN